MFADLDAKARLRALRGAFRKASGELRKQAIGNLRSSGLRSNRDVERGIRSVVWKRSLGFRVTIGTKKYRNKAQDLSESKRRCKGVVPLWAEGGTDERYSVRKTKKLGFSMNTRGSNRGRLKPYRFMERTKGDAEQLHARLVAALERNIERAALKNGGSIK